MIKVTIHDKVWKFYLLDADEFQSKFPGDAAVTLPGSCEVYVEEEELTMKNVQHEIFHVYRATLCTSSANLTSDQEEEICAELFSEHGQRMIRLARKIFKELKNERG